MSTATAVAFESAPAPTLSASRLVRVRELWESSKTSQLEIGRLLYEEREERIGVGGRGTREGFHQWLRDAGIPKTSAYRRIAEYEISIGVRAEEPEDKPVPNGTTILQRAIDQEGKETLHQLRAAIDRRLNPEKVAAIQPEPESFESRDERQSASDEVPVVTEKMKAWLRNLLNRKKGLSSFTAYAQGEKHGFTSAEVAQAASELGVDFSEEPWRLPTDEEVGEAADPDAITTSLIEFWGNAAEDAFKGSPEDRRKAIRKMEVDLARLQRAVGAQ